MKQINFVYSRNKLDFKKFAKSSDYNDVVSYHDIITKLVKNDNDNEKPSDFVVNSYLRIKIVKTMTDDNSTKIIYALKDLNPYIISSIKELMSEYCEDEIEFSLTIIQHKKLPISENDMLDIKSIDFLNKIDYITI